MKQEMKYRFEQSKSGNVHKLYVYDTVKAKGKFNWSTWEYEDAKTSAKCFRDQLDQIPNGDTIEIHINSAGGEVSEGVTIYNLLRQKAQSGCRIVGYVDGSAYSIAMTIVMACDEIHMGLGTSMFLHNPWASYVSGNAEDLRNIANQLDVLAASSRQLYLSRAKDLTEEDLIRMMDDETMLDPETCLKYGFCDFVGETVEDPDDDTDPDDVPDPDDDKDLQIAQLRKMLFTQSQMQQMINEMKMQQKAPELPKRSIKELLNTAF